MEPLSGPWGLIESDLLDVRNDAGRYGFSHFPLLNWSG